MLEPQRHECDTPNQRRQHDRLQQHIIDIATPLPVGKPTRSHCGKQGEEQYLMAAHQGKVIAGAGRHIGM